MEEKIREFAEYVKEHLPDYLPVSGEYQIQIQAILKENDTKLTAICISEKDAPNSTCIYLDGLINHYMWQYNSLDMEEALNSSTMRRIICQNVADVFRESGRQTINISELSKAMESYQNAREYLRVGICSPEKNEESLKTQVYHMCGDFAEYYYLADVGIENTMIKVTETMLESWNVSKDEVQMAAMENMKQDMTLMHLEQFAELLGIEPDEAEHIPDLRILTNTKMNHGAGMILNPDIQKKIAQTVQGDYYVLPSSIHEVLIYPEQEDTELEMLASLVKNVNQTNVSETDFLSDEVQHYSAHAHILENAHVYQENVKKYPEKYGKERQEKTKEFSKQALPPAFH